MKVTLRGGPWDKETREVTDLVTHIRMPVYKRGVQYHEYVIEKKKGIYKGVSA